MASDPNQVLLGAPVFYDAGHTQVGPGGNLTTLNTSVSQLNIDGGLARPLQKPFFDPSIYLIGENITPLTDLSSKAPFTELTTDQFTCEYTVDRMPPDITRAMGSTALAGTVLHVQHGEMFVPRSTVYVRQAGEAFGQVSSVAFVAGYTGTADVTVAWYAGQAPTVAITAGMDLMVTGNAHAEHSLPQFYPITGKVQAFAYLQQLKFGFEESERVKVSQFQIGGDVLATEMRKLRLFATVEIEKARWWNRTGLAADGTGRIEGIYHVAGASRTDMLTADLTETLFDDAIDRLRRHRPGENYGPVIAFCSTRQRRMITGFGATSRRIEPTSKEWGLDVNKWLASDGGGEVMLHTCKLFDACGRDDLIVLFRMDPKAFFTLKGTLRPELSWVPHVIPNGAPWSAGHYERILGQFVKDARGHVGILYNLSAGATTI